MNIAIIEDSQPKTGLISKELEKYPYRKILAKFNIILKKTSKIYYEILRENPNKLNNEILTYMGFQNRKKNHQFSVSELENLAIQASHLILNKFFTYYVIKAQIHKNYGLKIGNLYDRSRNKEFQEQINEKFREIVETFEIAPIFQTEIFDNSIQFSEKLSNTLQEANNLFLELKIENLDDDIISNLYQMFIPFEEKKKLGQIYTPNEIADLMANLVIQNPNDVILDPACGCGTLLRSSYYRLKHLKKQRGIATDHKKLLSQIWGIEINAFPAQISMMSLAFMDLSEITQTAGIIMEDFLNIGPLKKYFVKSKNFMTGKIITRRMPGIFDVIIANPPYIKQELIPNKKKMMKNLPLFASYRKNSIKKNNSSISKNKTSKINLELTGKTDYYGFFLWYSTYFLKDHGKLCFIIPNKWMDVEYGQNLKKFILEKYKIIAIIGFNKNVFKNAQVSTVFLILQKERDKFKRNHHYVRFINILNKSGRIKLENLINTPLKSVFKAKIDWDDYIFKNNDPDLNCTYTRQDHLNISEKWSFKYLFQSKFSQILSKKSLISMDNHKITSIVGGIKTGANDFYFPSYENQEKFAIETQFLIPGIKTGRSIPTEYIINETKTKFLSVPA
ncbi:MAG: HsdM family class I SAM-dependent methyltransferase, partial [Promethearchaeota archaeon]